MTFDAAEPGTPAVAWAAYRAGLPELDTGPLQRLVVAAAHPDDETLMAGGLIAHAAGRGLPVVVLLASSGEGSHPRSPTWTPEALAAEREREVAAAIGRLAPAARLVHLRLPDGALAEHEAAITDALVAELAPGDTLVSTWSGDRHPDHAAVARAAAAAARQQDAVHLQAPIWLWHWGDPEETAALPDAARFDLDAAVVAVKRDAIALHVTQVEPLSPAPGDEVLLHAGTIAHFLVDDEVLLPTSPARPVDFDGMYAASDDPWGFDERWYEERKRAVMLASLPKPRFRRVLEIGCSVGTITAALADRADAVVATDVADRAIAQTRERLRRRTGVVVEQLRLPEEWPDAWSAEPFDLVVLSEVGFYLAGEALGEVVERSRDALAPGGVFVACHWRPHVLGLDRGGDAVHRVIRERIGARRIVEHVEDDFVLEVFQTEPSASVAQATGLR